MKYDNLINIFHSMKQKTEQFLADNVDLKSLSAKSLLLWQQKKSVIIKTAIPLLIVGTAIYSCSSSQKLIISNMADIFKISDDIRLFYSTQPDYWGLSTQTAIQKKMVADSYIRANKIIIGGNNEIFIGNGANGDMVMPQTQTFDIALSGLTKAQCISYVEFNINADNLVKVVQISIENSVGKYAFEWGGKNELPVKKYTAKAYCQDSNNTVIWRLR